MKEHYTSAPPSVDIVIPVYNVESYLRRCLDSILAQTYHAWRAICVDDGSTDGSAEILEAYASIDPRFKVVRKQNGGLSDARNHGVAASDAEYLMFVDSDDFIHPQTLEIAVGLALRDGSDIVSWYRDAQYRNTQLKLCRLFHRNPITSRPWRIGRRYSLSSIKSTVTDNVLGHCSDWGNSSRAGTIKHCYVWRHLFRRDTIADVPFIRGLCYEDIPWWSEIILKPLRATITSLPLYYYYKNPESISRCTGDIRKAEDILTGLIATHNLYISKATEQQIYLWSHNIKWAVLNGLSENIQETISSGDSVNLIRIVKELCTSGVIDDAQDEIENKARQIIIESWKTQDSDNCCPVAGTNS